MPEDISQTSESRRPRDSRSAALATGRGSMLAGTLCAMFVLSLITTLLLRWTSHLRSSLGWTEANIVGHWIVLTCSLATGAAAIAMGVHAFRKHSRPERTWGIVGLVLGAISLSSLAVWELSGWWFSLFWDI